MTAAVSIVILGGALVFIIGSLARAIRYARQPIHLRWELYPVPHEDPRRVQHGGSYFEDVDWWTRPREFHLIGELRFMVPEMLFMRGLWDFNRAMWVRSFPFHFGLYLVIGTVKLLVLVLLLDILAPGLLAGTVGLAVHWVYTITGIVGVILASLGAILLLIRRLTHEDLKTYTTPGDILNLTWFVVSFGCLLGGFLLRAPDSAGAVAILRAILFLDSGVRIPGLLAVGLILSALLAAYIPFTHMSHFIAKYFTYHAIRWDDRSLRSGDRIEKKLAEYLTYRPTWSARHVGADGAKTWTDVATTNPAEGGKR
jgi:nitrate reductase gamma subunit